MQRFPRDCIQLIYAVCVYRAPPEGRAPHSHSEKMKMFLASSPSAETEPNTHSHWWPPVLLGVASSSWFSWDCLGVKVQVGKAAMIPSKAGWWVIPLIFDLSPRLPPPLETRWLGWVSCNSLLPWQILLIDWGAPTCLAETEPGPKRSHLCSRQPLLNTLNRRVRKLIFHPCPWIIEALG